MPVPVLNHPVRGAALCPHGGGRVNLRNCSVSTCISIPARAGVLAHAFGTRPPDIELSEAPDAAGSTPGAPSAAEGDDERAAAIATITRICSARRLSV